MLNACSGSSSTENKPRLTQDDIPVETLYNNAISALDKGRNNEATRLFNEVERLYPYSEWARRAQINAAFSEYEDQRYDSALVALERYIELYPGSKSIDYAYYLTALSYYEQISDVKRDQRMTELALQSFNQLIDRFPASKYARDGIYKRDLTLDHLAGKEMEIGRYYLKRGYAQSAITRFNVVINDYETTTHTAEALHRLVEAYLMIGLKDEAVRNASVLGYNYPGSKWYQDSYKLLDAKSRQELLKERSLVDRVADSIFDRE